MQNYKTLRLRAALSLLAGAGALGALSGCADLFPNDKTTGDEGRLVFTYDSQCFLDCSLDNTIAVGSSELISIDGNDNYAFESSNPEIASFALQQVSCSCEQSSQNEASGYSVDPGGSCQSGYHLRCKTEIQANAKGEGDAKLIVNDANGKLVDRVTVHVRLAQSVTFSRDTNDSSSNTSKIDGAPGTQVSVHAVFADTEGNALLSSSGVTWSSDDTDIATVQKEELWLNWSRGSQAKLSLKQNGQTVIRAKLGGFKAALPVTVSE